MLFKAVGKLFLFLWCIVQYSLTVVEIVNLCYNFNQDNLSALSFCVIGSAGWTIMAIILFKEKI